MIATAAALGEGVGTVGDGEETGEVTQEGDGVEAIGDGARARNQGRDGAGHGSAEG